MATTSPNPTRSPFSFLITPFSAAFDALIAIGEARQINQEAKTLFELPEQELERRGLRREEIGLYLVSRMPNL